MSKERPHICSAWEVQALLAGRKTQLRVPIKPQPTKWHTVKREPFTLDNQSGIWSPLADNSENRRSPLGVPGDRVWIKETWCPVWPGVEPVPLHECNIEYRADLPVGCRDYPGGWYEDDAKGDPDAPRWMPPRSMPREYCRLVVEIEEVIPQRVMEISPQDAIAEGIETAEMVRHRGGDFSHGVQGWMNYGPPRSYNFATPQESYAILWDARYAKKGYPFSSNPWAWQYTFRVI